MAKITADVIEALAIKCRNERNAASVKVDDAPGLWLRFTERGVGSWSLVYRPKGSKALRRYNLGRVDDVSIKVAKQRAIDWRSNISNGVDPHEAARKEREKEAEERRQAIEKAAAEAAAKAAKKARINVDEAIAEFGVARKKNRSIKQALQMLGVELGAKHGQTALADLTKADVYRIHNTIAAKGHDRHADHVMSTIRSLLSWGVEQGHIATNVASRFKKKQKPKEGRRERKLTADEMKALWLILDRDDVGLTITMRRIIRLAMLIGSRLNEIAGMRRGELSADLRVWKIPAGRMKANEEHELPLPPHAREIIREALSQSSVACVFPGREGKKLASTSVSHAMAKLQAHLMFVDADGEPSPVKCHDLRRTLATGLQRLGVEMSVIKRILAHAEDGSDVTTTHYAQAELTDKAKEALIMWQKAVAAMVRGEDPFASSTEADDELERRLLGSDLVIKSDATLPDNVVKLKIA